MLTWFPTALSVTFFTSSFLFPFFLGLTTFHSLPCRSLGGAVGSSRSHGILPGLRLTTVSPTSEALFNGLCDGESQLLDLFLQGSETRVVALSVSRKTPRLGRAPRTFLGRAHNHSRKLFPQGLVFLLKQRRHRIRESWAGLSLLDNSIIPVSRTA